MSWERQIVITEEKGQTKQFNILLVEDNYTDVLLVESHIQKLNEFALYVVTTISQAIKDLNSRSFDIVLLDLNLPDALGLEGLIKLKKYVHKIPIVILSGIDNAELGIMALQRGAQDYLIKEVDSYRLMKAIRYAIERKAVDNLDNSNADKSISIGANEEDTSVSRPVLKKYQRNKLYDELTGRELQVLKLLGKGFSNLEIAECLQLSVNTVKTHIANILRKFSVSDRTKAIIQAQNHGLI